MNAVPADPKAEAAVLTLRENRLRLRRVFGGPPRGAFPRSHTFRWFASHLNMRSLLSTAMTAAFLRPSLMQLLSMLFLRRRA
jgi:hypothetical protein